MKLEIETSFYNERRYSKPYIAKVDYSKREEGEMTWGKYIGNHGFAGKLTIDVNLGDIVMRGQKDYRRPHTSHPTYYEVKLDGELEEIGNCKVRARKVFLKNDNKNSLLQQEKEKLLQRLDEIELELNK